MKLNFSFDSLIDRVVCYLGWVLAGFLFALNYIRMGDPFSYGSSILIAVYLTYSFLSYIVTLFDWYLSGRNKSE